MYPYDLEVTIIELYITTKSGPDSFQRGLLQ